MSTEIRESDKKLLYMRKFCSENRDKLFKTASIQNFIGEGKAVIIDEFSVRQFIQQRIACVTDGNISTIGRSSFLVLKYLNSFITNLDRIGLQSIWVLNGKYNPAFFSDGNEDALEIGSFVENLRRHEIIDEDFLSNFSEVYEGAKSALERKTEKDVTLEPFFSQSNLLTIAINKLFDEVIHSGKVVGIVRTIYNASAHMKWLFKNGYTNSQGCYFQISAVVSNNFDLCGFDLPLIHLEDPDALICRTGLLPNFPVNLFEEKSACTVSDVEAFQFIPSEHFSLTAYNLGVQKLLQMLQGPGSEAIKMELIQRECSLETFQSSLPDFSTLAGNEDFSSRDISKLGGSWEISRSDQRFRGEFKLFLLADIAAFCIYHIIKGNFVDARLSDSVLHSLCNQSTTYREDLVSSYKAARALRFLEENSSAMRNLPPRDLQVDYLQY